MRVKSWSKLAVVVVVLVLGGAVATAWASVPDKRGIVHTCYKKKSGNVRVSASGKCKKNERKLNLNAQGRQGKQGLRGIRGIRGIRGATGPSDAWVLRPDTTSQPTGTGKYVAELPLPAGSYSVNAKFRVLGGSGATNVDCSLSVGSTYLTSDNVNLGASPDRQILAFTDIAVLDTAGAIRLYCGPTLGPSFDVDEIRMTAVRVGAAHVVD